MTPLERLIRAKERLMKGWTQGKYAVGANGSALYSDNPEAVQWCLLGALGRASFSGESTRDIIDATVPLAECIEATGFETEGEGVLTTVLFYNDFPGRTKEEVMKVVDCAIEKLQPEVKSEFPMPPALPF